MREIKTNTIYKDHKGLLYYVEAISTNTIDGRKYVVYRDVYNLEKKQYSDVKAVVLDAFMVKVNRDKYPNLKQEYYLEEYEDLNEQREIIAGDRYRHFKGIEVEIIGIAKHSEDLSEYVVYKELSDNNLWIRPIDMFNSKVDKTKYPDIEQVYRFEKIGG